MGYDRHAPRVHWSTEEREKIALSAAPLVAAGREDWSAVMVAQEMVLPTTRRRVLRKKQDIRPDLSKAIKSALRALKLEGPTEQGNLALPDRGATNTEEAPAVTPAASAAAPVGALPPAVSLDDTILQMARMIGDTIAAQAFNEIKVRLAVMAGSFVRQETRSAVSAARPRVLVVGPIPEQQNRLREEFGDLLDLRFVASGESPKRVGEIQNGCEKVVLWTRFINHQHQEHAPREKRVLVGGGFDALRDALTAEAIH